MTRVYTGSPSGHPSRVLHACGIALTLASRTRRRDPIYRIETVSSLVGAGQSTRGRPVCYFGLRAYSNP